MVSIEHRIYSCLLTVFRHLFSIVSPLEASSMIVKTEPMDRLQHYSIVAGGDCRCWQTRAETRVQGHSRHSEHHQTRRRYYLSNGCGLNFIIMPSTLSDRPLIISRITFIFIIFPSYKLPECACIFAATKLKVVCLKLQYPDHVRAGR